MLNTASIVDRSNAAIASETLIKLVQAGFIGLAALLLVLVFVILWRNQPADASTARLRMTYLILGFGSVIFAGLMQLVPTRATASITISPDLAEVALSIPGIVILPSGETVTPDTLFTVASNSTIRIKTDRLIKDAQNLQKTALALAQTNARLIKPAADALPGISQIQAVEATALSQDISRGIAHGDFADAALGAVELREAAMRW